MIAENEKEDLGNLITELCKSGLSQLDEEKLKKVKSYCKSNEEYLKLSYEILITNLNKEHSEIRYSTFRLIDCLFQRSSFFREVILDDFQDLFELVLETNPDEPLPPPRRAANELKKLASKTIKAWHDKFGSDYKKLDLGFNYLKNCKKIDFVSFTHQTNAERNHQQKQAERQEIFLNKKYAEYVAEMNDRISDIKNCIEQLERSINILIPKEEELFQEEDFNLSSKKTPSNELDPLLLDGSDSDDDEDEDDFVEVPVKKTKEEQEKETNEEVKYLGFLDKADDLKTINIKIDLFLKENDENKVLIDIMRDLYKELKNSHLIKINMWIKNFTQIKQSSQNLKQAIELKNSIQQILKKFDDLNIQPLEKEVKKPLVKATDKACTSKQASQELDLNKTDKKKQEMLKIAPVINLDEFEFLAPIVQKVETNHPMFQRRENDIQVDAISNSSRMTIKTFIGKMEPIKWSCRAPLKSGRLCPRMDRYKCPLHGKIVARNEKGEIANEKDKIEAEKNKKEVLAWQDEDLIADINAAAGTNLITGTKKGKKTKRKSGNLTDLSKEDNTTRKRLEKRLLDSKNLKKIGSILDSIERRQNYEKFHHNFNYSIQS